MIHDASHSYTYDAENRLTQVDGGSTATYAYDVEGRRASKVVGGVETDYIYDLSGHVVETYGGGCGITCLNTAYLYLNGQLLAEYTGGTTYFVHEDHLGSTRLVTGYPTASVVECDDYYPFGEQISCGGTSTTTHKFTGYERDAESGLDNAQARYNSSTLGRFMSPDPVGIFVADATNPQTWNMYTYVNNNPLAFIDPSGTDALDALDCPGGSGGNDCGGFTFTIPPIFTQSNPPTCWGSSCPVWDPLEPINPPQPPPTSGGGGGGRGVCPLNSAGISTCIAAPPPPQKPAPSKPANYKNCVKGAAHDELKKNDAQFKHDVKSSFVVGPLMGAGVCGAVVAAEPEFAPVFVPCAVGGAVGVTSTFLTLNFTANVIRNIASTVGVLGFCAENEF